MDCLQNPSFFYQAAEDRVNDIKLAGQSANVCLAISWVRGDFL